MCRQGRREQIVGYQEAWPYIHGVATCRLIIIVTIQQVKLLQRWVHEGDAPNPIYMCGTEALARIVSEVSKKLGFDP